MNTRDETALMPPPPTLGAALGRPSNSPTRRPTGRTAVARHAFTLVELLVVIGIIGVLTALLMPALSGARKAANTVKCASNLRQLATAWQSYANQNKRVSVPGRLPTLAKPGGTYDLDNGLQYRPRWYELLGAVNGVYACKNPKAIEDDSWTITNDVFLCPEVPDWNNSRNYPYGYNFQFLGNARPRSTAAAGGILMWVNYPVISSRIKASETVMAVDCVGTAAGLPEADRKGYYADGTKSVASRGNKASFVDPPLMAVGSSDFADAQNRSPQARSGPDPRHKKKLNAAFCDGHVELVTPQDLGYEVAANGAIGLNGRNNKFSGNGDNILPPSFQ